MITGSAKHRAVQIAGGRSIAAAGGVAAMDLPRAGGAGVGEVRCLIASTTPAAIDRSSASWVAIGVLKTKASGKYIRKPTTLYWPQRKLERMRDRRKV